MKKSALLFSTYISEGDTQNFISHFISNQSPPENLNLFK